MPYNNIMSYYPQNMYVSNNLRDCSSRQLGPGRPRPPMGPGNRPGGFLLPFALGFVSSPLIFGATRPRPYYGPYYGPGYGPGFGPYPYY